MNKPRVATIALGVFSGLGGASHGPGELLQGNVAPSNPFISAWPQLTELNGEPAMTIIPNYLITGLLAIIIGVTVAAWAATRTNKKQGGLSLILLSIALLLLGGGIIPPFFGVAAGLIAMWTNHKSTKKEVDLP